MGGGRASGLEKAMVECGKRGRENGVAVDCRLAMSKSAGG